MLPMPSPLQRYAKSRPKAMAAEKPTPALPSCLLADFHAAAMAACDNPHAQQHDHNQHDLAHDPPITVASQSAYAYMADGALAALAMETRKVRWPSPTRGSANAAPLNRTCSLLS